ncbi:uncharacterized protein [Miscanthus floridulus]|uniref:uncharacterized protein n=1 Tax=Miscanthus floridulus TaxID=154761 RepID=UPI0034588799
MTDDTYRDDDEKKEKKEKKDEKKKKSVAFKATSSKGKVKQDTLSEDDGLCARRKKSSSKNKDEIMRCFKCGSKDHRVAQCPYNSDNSDDNKKNKKEKKEKDKMTFNKKKKGGSYVVTWDSDASSSDDDDSDNDKTTKKKALASIAINENPLLFDTPSCFMAKATKVQTYDDGSDEEHGNENDSDSDDDEPTKDDLFDILEDAKEHFDIKRRECKSLNKEDVTPNEVLGDVMTEDQYNSDGEEIVKEVDKKKKSMAFKADTSSSKTKSKGKAKKEESSDEECSHDDSNDEALALFVHKFGKMKKKKGYGARKRRDHLKNKEYVRLCYKCKNPNHIVVDCPYNSDNEDNEKKKNKKEKKEKKEKKMIFKKNKGGSYVVTWDSDASTDDESSDDDKASKKKALASIAINNRPSLVDTPSCFMAKGSKVKYDESENDDSESENNSDDYEFSNEQLMNMLE